MSKDLTVLAENRDVLLTAEIACWLHMIGKYTKEFIEGDHTKSIQLPKGLSQNLLTILKEDLLQKTIRKLPIKDLQMPLVVEEFVSKHELGNNVIKDDRNAFNKLLNDAHGRGSGTEKGVLKNDAYSNQNNSSIHISTAFGYEANPTDADLIDQNSKELYTLIENVLIEMLRILEISNADNLERLSKLRTELITALNQHFAKAIGDTRRPINDVTLWDQTISSVAFFKAELAESLINGYKDPFDKDNKYIFRYLHVTFDGESYVAKGTGIGDTITRRKLIDEAFDSAKLLIEVEYPLGLEIYRDTNGITFLIPELSEKLTIDDLVVKKEVSLKQTISEKITVSTNWEVTPFFHISERPSRSLHNLGSMISKRPDGNIPYLKLKELWTEKEELCPSCNIRPIEANSRKRGIKFCEECYKRITGRGKQWVENRNNQTVWIDEIADSKGKVALLSFSLSVANWLDTNNISTFSIHNCRTLQFEEMVRQFGADPKHTKTNLNNRRYSEYLKIGNSFKKENLSVAELFNLVCEEENIKLNDAENLVLSIWRKPPSFARVRRVWETTSKFWDEALAEIKGVINPITERIVLKVRTNDLNLPPNNAYEAKVNETKFTVFYENKNPKGTDGLENFVIIENLDLLAKKLGIKKDSRKDLVDVLIEGLEDKNKDKNIDFFNSNDPSAVLASSRIEGIEIESCNYSPVIEITKDPERFMVLVPADKALEAAKKIKEKYEKEMGKVRNRLPMNLGIVYAGYHTALPAIMDAGRRIMQINNEEKPWTLMKQPEEFSDYFELTFEENQVWRIPSKMGDCSEDVWYPYFYVDNLDKVEREKRCLSFKGPSGNWLVHVSQLKEGDKVLVTPSYFDFEYLSSASQRFEISYNGESRRRSKDRKHRPYYLDDLDKIERVWVILSTRLSNSQIKKLNTLVEEKRRDWTDSLGEKDETFKSYVENVIDNLRWKQSLAKDEKDTLVDFCVSRKLADVLEIHMSILKDKSEVAE